jgi:hypothetical protein
MSELPDKTIIEALEERKQELEAQFWEGQSTHGAAVVRPLSVPRLVLQARIAEVDNTIEMLRGKYWFITSVPMRED